MKIRANFKKRRLLSSFLSSVLVASVLAIVALGFKLPYRSVPIIFTTFFLLDRIF